MKKLTRKQYYKWLSLQSKDKCLFCDWKENQVLHKEFKHWIWIDNIAPYWNYYGVLVPKRHFEEYKDMTEKEGKELSLVTDYVAKKIIDVSPKLTGEFNQVQFIWRKRFINEENRPTHFHINVGPDCDGRLNSTINKSAYKKDTSMFK